ncbi:hypothetical protein PV11_01953 [Exophiala sideris]|uniref:Zn(2)-C6 fungal-type domain-containing protein n=1 Tax=Exophiala sideris TaxID=1016849 RepID=A0A0D1XE67_9EURO|nr:hypothetical protein PV11_01953 [Exophiala sideris]
MPSRISGACNGCRTKKQKCSGDRSGCLQCQAAAIQCTWPEQRKRGPAKGYIEGLEHRLHEAESLILALLPVITTEQLNSAAETLNSTASSADIMGLKSRDSQSPGPRNVRSSPPTLNKKTGIEYWEAFPLDTAENIRKWQQDCAVHSSGQNPPSLRTSLTAEEPFSQSILHQNFMPDSKSHSRAGSVEFSSHNHARSSSATFPSLNDPYRSETSTPVNVTQHSHSRPTVTTTSNSHQPPTSQPQSSQQNWQSMSLFSGTGSNTSTPQGVGIGAEALLLQSFADSSWAQSQSLNNGLHDVNSSMGANSNMDMQSGLMEVDTGLFANDMQRRLFW